MATNSIFGGQAQFNKYQYDANRSLLIIKEASAKRMEADIAKIEGKYKNDRRVSDLEKQISSIGTEAIDTTTKLSTVQSGLKNINDIRVQLLAMRDTLKRPDAAQKAVVFDYAYDTINGYAGTRASDANSLISNSYKGNGQWDKSSETFVAGLTPVTLTHRFLGSDFVIQPDGGGKELRQATGVAGALVGGDDGSIDKSEISNVKVNGGNITFDVTKAGATPEDPSTTSSVSGTLQRGGGGVLKAWAYNNFSTAEDKERATNDINNALKQLAKDEQGLMNNDITLQRVKTTLTNKNKGLQDQYKKISTENLTAMQAERRAVSTRFDMLNNQLALTSSSAQTMIYQLFVKTPAAKQTLMDALYAANGY